MDYSKMKATKVEKSSSGTNINISKKDIKKSKTSLKRAGVSWIIVAVFLVIGAVVGYLATYFVSKNDTYEMVAYANGSYDVCIGQNEDIKTYTELGVKCIAFGKDVSKNFKVTYFYRSDLTEDEVKVDKVDESVEGIYYAVYTSPSKKYSTVKLIRNIIVLRGEDDV